MILEGKNSAILSSVSCNPAKFVHWLTIKSVYLADSQSLGHRDLPLWGVADELSALEINACYCRMNEGINE